MGIRRVSPSKLVEDIYKRGRSYREFVGYEGGTQKAIPVPENGSWTRKATAPLHSAARMRRLPVTTTTPKRAGL